MTATAPDLLARLAAIVGETHVLSTEADMAPHLVEWRGLYRGRAQAVVKPGSTPRAAAASTTAPGAG